jgi:disulfide bond formation protein DsbB
MSKSAFFVSFSFTLGTVTSILSFFLSLTPPFFTSFSFIFTKPFFIKFSIWFLETSSFSHKNLSSLLSLSAVKFILNPFFYLILPKLDKKINFN